MLCFPTSNYVVVDFIEYRFVCLTKDPIKMQIQISYVKNWILPEIYLGRIALMVTF